MKGRRTYLALAGVAASMLVGVAARHGLDLGPVQQDLADALVLLFTGAAAYLRSIATTEA